MKWIEKEKRSFSLKLLRRVQNNLNYLKENTALKDSIESMLSDIKQVIEVLKREQTKDWGRQESKPLPIIKEAENDD